MSEELEQQNDGTWSGLKKTLLGTVATVITAGGAWLGSTLFGGGSEEKAQPASQPNIIINNTQQQQQAAGGGKTVIIKEKAAEPAKPATPVKKKNGDEFKEKEPLW
jgi:hypothetical protein